MTQQYTQIGSGETLANSLTEILNNDLTAISQSSGTTFPTANLQVGMPCFRTDQNKLYVLKDATPTWVLVDDLNRTPTWNDNPTFTGTLAAPGLSVVPNASLPAATGSKIILSGDYGATFSGRLFIGDGTGWKFGISKRSASATTDLHSFVDSGVVLLNRTTDDASGATLQVGGLISASSSPTTGDNSALVPTTSWVQTLTRSNASVSVAGGSNVTLTQAQYGVFSITLTGALTANISVIFPNTGSWVVDNQTTGAYTVTCKTAAGTGVTISQGYTQAIFANGTNVKSEQTDFNSVSLTGNTTAVTQNAGDNSTKVSTTAFTQTAIANAVAILADTAVRQTVLQGRCDNYGAANFLEVQPGSVSQMHFESALTDSSGMVWTAPNGQTWDTTNKKFGAASLSLNGTSQYLFASGAPLLGTLNAWTIELWFKQSSVGVARTLFSGFPTAAAGSGVMFGLNASNIPMLYLGAVSGSWTIANGVTGGSALTDTASFHHAAVSFDGSNYRMFIDGTLVITVASTAKICNTDFYNIGTYTNNQYWWPGNIDEFRISNYAVYTAGFTPSSSAFADALAQVTVRANSSNPLIATFAGGFNAGGQLDYVTSPITADYSYPASFAPGVQRATVYPYLDRNTSTGAITYGYSTTGPQYGYGIGNTTPQASLMHFESGLTDDYGVSWTAYGAAAASSAQAKLGTQSLSLNGTTQYLENLNPMQLGQLNAWTIEGYFRKSAIGTTKDLFALNNGTSSYGPLLIEFSSSNNKPNLYLSSANASWDITGGNLVPTTPAWVANQWYHLALVFDGQTYKLYQDGALGATVSTPVKVALGSSFTLGRWLNTSAYFDGYVDEFRISAQARYTAAFTPPAAPFTADESWPAYNITGGQMTSQGAAAGAAIQRVFMGELVVNGNAIMSATTYALQGKYFGYIDRGSMWTASATAITLNHNLGVTPAANKSAWTIQAVIPDAGLAAGEEVPIYQVTQGASPLNINLGGRTSKNSASLTLVYGTAYILGGTNSGGGYSTVSTWQNFRAKYYADRGW